MSGAIAGGAVTGAVELTELLDVEVNELARALALIAADWLGRLERLQAIEPETTQNARDGGFGDAGFARNLHPCPALAP